MRKYLRKTLVAIAIIVGMSVFENTQTIAQPTSPPQSMPSQKALLGDKSIAAILPSVVGGIQIPMLDMSDRFGANAFIGLGIGFKTRKNWLIGGEASFMFGNKVRDTLLMQNLKNANGVVLAMDGLPADLVISERGYRAGGYIGKIFPVQVKNQNSGVFVQLGGGFMQYKILLDDQSDKLPQLAGDYIKGYDRLTSGFTLSEFVGYMHLDRRKLINFYIGVEVIQGFTKNRRTFHFDTGMLSSKTRQDWLIGLKGGWILPFYNTKEERRFYVR